MPTAIDLPELHGRISVAEELLARSPNLAGVHQAIDQLVSLEGFLALLIADDTLPTDIAVCLNRVRDDLSSHVCAALDLDDIAPVPQTVALIQRGTAAAHASIDDISRTDRTD